MGLTDLTRPAVLEAIAECDRLSRPAFLEVYGFREARRYFIEYHGNQYDSKAIAGVAHRFIENDRGPLTADQFSGGEASVAKKLRELGFVVSPVTKSKRNPSWSRDELILALDLYMSNPVSPPGKDSREIHELSLTLSELGRRLGHNLDGDYRNANGVYMKLMNFRRFDPAFIGIGKVGLKRGNKDEAKVWEVFSEDRARLASVAAAIRVALQSESVSAPDDLNEDIEAEEGRLLSILHLRRERDRKLVEGKKRIAIQRYGQLQCEACDFIFAERYG